MDDRVDELWGYERYALDRIRQLAALTEPAMRRASLLRALRDESDREAIFLLEHLVRSAVKKEPASLSVYAALMDPDLAERELGPERLDELLHAARDTGCVAANVWLYTPPSRERPDVVDPDYLVDREFRAMTLGHRRALARRAKGDVLRKLLADPDPAVIDNVLANPSTVEQHVLVICARRPTVSQALEAVVRTPRWVARYAVKQALAMNPYLRHRVALCLLPTLTTHDLTAIRDDDTLAGSIRLAAQRLLELG